MNPLTFQSSVILKKDNESGKQRAHWVLAGLIAIILAGEYFQLHFNPPELSAETASTLLTMKAATIPQGLGVARLPDMLPGVLMAVLHFNAGTAIILSALLYELVGLTGLYGWFRKAGFSMGAIMISMVILTLAASSFLLFFDYKGADWLLFAFTGWFFWGWIAVFSQSIIIFKSPVVRLLSISAALYWAYFYRFDAHLSFLLIFLVSVIQLPVIIELLYIKASDYNLSAVMICLGLIAIQTGSSFSNSKGRNTPGPSGISQPAIDERSLSQIIKLDNETRNATFVFINPSIALEIRHNRTITLPPIDNKLCINVDDYLHKGYYGQLFIIMPESYNGPKEKFILKSFPDYKGWYGSMLGNDFVMYSAH